MDVNIPNSTHAEAESNHWSRVCDSSENRFKYDLISPSLTLGSSVIIDENTHFFLSHALM